MGFGFSHFLHTRHFLSVSILQYLSPSFIVFASRFIFCLFKKFQTKPSLILCHYQTPMKPQKILRPTVSNCIYEHISYGCFAGSCRCHTIFAKVKIYAYLVYDIYRYRHRPLPNRYRMNTRLMRHIYEFLHTDSFIYLWMNTHILTLSLCSSNHSRFSLVPLNLSDAKLFFLLMCSIRS